MSLESKVEKQIGAWKYNTLFKVKAKHRRFKIKEVARETVLAYFVQLNNVDYWLPKSICTVGIEPGGKYYAVDIPQWYIDKYNIKS